MDILSKSVVSVNGARTIKDLGTFLKLGQAYNRSKGVAEAYGNGRARERVAEEFGVGTKTIERAGWFASGIEAIRKRYPELADSIMKEQKHGIKQDIQAIGQADAKTQKEMIEALARGHGVHSGQSKRSTAENRNRISEIADVVSGMFGESTQCEYGINELLREIEMNSGPFIKLIRQIIDRNSNIVMENKHRVEKALLEGVIIKIEDIEEEIRKL